MSHAKRKFRLGEDPPPRCKKCGRPIHSNQSRIDGVCGLCAQNLPDNGGEG